MEHTPCAVQTKTDLDIITGWCKGCGLCVSSCPKNILHLDEKGKITVTIPEKCTGCGTCESTCPDFAISVRMKKHA